MEFLRRDVREVDETLRRWARRYATTPEEAEDVAQDTWLAAVEAETDAVRNWLPWMRSVVRYRSRYYRDRHAIRGDPERLDDVVVESPQQPIGGDDETARRVRAAVEALEDPYRTVVELHYVQGLSIDQIAVRTQRRPATIKSQLHRARSKLRTRLERDLGPDRTLVVLLTRAFARLPVQIAAAAIVLTTAAIGILATDPTTARLDAILRSASREPTLPATSARLDDSAPTTGRAVLVGHGAVRVHCVDTAGVALTEKLVVELEPVGQTGTTGSTKSLAAGGSVTFEAVPSGAWRIRAGSRELDAHVAPGTMVDLTLRFPRELALVGRTIVHGSERAVPQAEIWTCAAHRPETARLVTYSDDDGVFRLPKVAVDHWVGARTAGLLSSTWAILDEPAAQGGRELLLPLREPRATLVGLVQDELGEPIPGATITAVDTALDAYVHEHSWWRFGALPRKAQTNREGRFSWMLEGTRSRVRISAPGRAPLVVDLPRPERVDGMPTDFTLGPGCALTGLVTDSRARPAPGAVVTFRPWDRALVASRTRTDERGAFTLTGLPSVVGTLSATARVDARLERDRRSLDLRRPVPVSDLRMQPGEAVRGRAVDPHGRSLAGWTVMARPAGLPTIVDSLRARHGEVLSTTTDADGTFALETDAPVDVHLLPAEHGARSVAVALDVEAPAEIELVADMRPRGALTGHVRTRDVPGVVILRSRALASDLVGTVDEAGDFAFEELSDGTYELYLWSAGAEPARVRSVRLLDAQSVDVGRLETPETGSLRISITSAPGLERCVGASQLSRVDSEQRLRYTPHDQLDWNASRAELTWADLAAGEYELAIRTASCATHYATVHVRSGVEEFVDVRLQRGALMELPIAIREPLDPAARLEVDVASHPEGRSLARYRLRLRFPSQAPVVREWLSPGEYSIFVESEVGFGEAYVSVSNEFDVTRPERLVLGR